MNGKPHLPPTKTPLWESVAMTLSFLLVWGYFMEFQFQSHGKLPVPRGWNVALGISVGVLVWILVRRLKRILAALDERNRRR